VNAQDDSRRLHISHAAAQQAIYGSLASDRAVSARWPAASVVKKRLAALQTAQFKAFALQVPGRPTGQRTFALLLERSEYI